MIKRDNAVIVYTDDSINDVWSSLKSRNASYGVVLTRDEVPVGLVFLRDIAQYITRSGMTGTQDKVSLIMQRDFNIIQEKTPMDDFLEEDIEEVIFPIVVTQENGTYSEVITKEDLIRILYQNLQYTKSILDNIDEGIVAVDKDNNIAYMNESWKRIHSVNEDELIGASIAETFPESKLGTEDLESPNEPLHLNFTGATVIPSYRPLLDQSNQPLGSMAIVKDYSKINDFYIGVSQVSMLNRLLDSAFDHLSEAVLYVDQEGHALYANSRAKELFDIEPGVRLEENSLGKMVYEKLRADKLESFREEIELETGSEEKTFNVVGIPIVDTQQTPDGLVLILQDVTSIKKLNYELKRHGNLLDFYEKQINKIPEDMICESPGFKEVVSTALKAAETDVTVLIEGENGVGKEMIANLIHKNSSRQDKPFIPVNCGAIPETLWESEMFGYEEGSFTGAKKGGKAGIFEIADGGTVFLDEIGEMSMATQVKMLRFLQNMEIAKVGRKDLKKVDVRIIAATNKNIEEMVKEEKFRMDLYYRLNVICLQVPPLRERKEEIGLLAHKFVTKFNERYNRSTEISEDAVRALEREYWPGNIRQLSNVIEQSVIMCDSVITAQDLQLENGKEAVGPFDPEHLIPEEERYNIPLRVGQVEKQMIEDALRECGGNKSKAIEMLHISRKTFYKKLRDHDIKG